MICPSWEEYARNETDVVLTIDPGSSFGSGGDGIQEFACGLWNRICLSEIGF